MDLAYRSTGDGPVVLLIHGGAECAAMLAPQAEAIAAVGRRVIWYDRRGTGGSTRADWPGGGVRRHADDVAELLRTLDAVPATVLGFSSGAVVALEVAAHHPDVVTEAIAWEPPALGVLPDGAALHAGLVAPLDAYLAAHPDDWVGAYHVMLRTLSDGRADLSAPLVRQAEANAEAILRDDAPVITRHGFGPGELPADRVTIAVSERPHDLHGAIAERLGELTGTAPVRVKGADDHEVYLHRPEVLAEFLALR